MKIDGKGILLLDGVFERLLRKKPIPKGISQEKSPIDIAQHHRVSLDQIIEQLKMGVEVEYEHTDDTLESRRIALDHLMEFPDYYTRLAKMEAEAEKDLEKAIKDTSKLIKRKKLVTRGGKTFLMTVYVNPAGEEVPLERKDLEKKYVFDDLLTGERIHIKGKKKSAEGELTYMYEYKGELYLTVKGDDGKSREILVKSMEETPITKIVSKSEKEVEFPKEIDEGEVGVVLGGSSEVRMYGTDFVMKSARARESGVRQLEYGEAADSVYRLMDFPVPDSKLYGDKRLLRFVEGDEYGDLEGKEKADVENIIRKGFVLDTVLANWDVIGANGDNIILGRDGKVYRIDNDGVFDLRARGGEKGFGFDVLGDMENMKRHNPVFSKVTNQELFEQAGKLYDNLSLIKATLMAKGVNDKTVHIVEERIKEIYAYSLDLMIGKKEGKKEGKKPWDIEKGRYGSAATAKYFEDWDEFEFEGNEGIKDAIKKNILSEENRVIWEKAAKEEGMSVEEWKWKMNEKLAQILSQCEFFSTQRFTTSGNSVVERIFESGRFKTQFDPDLRERRETGGSFTPEGRNFRENYLFGFVDDDKVYEKRPVYGYWSGETNGVLNSKGSIPPPNRVDGYGNVNFKIKREKAMKSATISFEDSLGSSSVCVPAAKPHFTMFGRTVPKISELDGILKGVKEGGYVESQIHGGLTLSDIESIHIPHAAMEYDKYGVKAADYTAKVISQLSNLVIEHAAESGNKIKLQAF